VLLLSKFLATLLLLTGLILAVGVAAVLIQIFRGQTPIDLLAYLRVYGIVLWPSAIFITAVSLFLNVLLRNKYLAYVVSIGTAAGLLYLYNIGFTHWLYNPLLYRPIVASGESLTCLSPLGSDKLQLNPPSDLLFKDESKDDYRRNSISERTHLLL